MKLLIGGSPCTHWSIAQTKSRETEPTGLGWELFKNYLIAKEKFQPDYFLYENNKSMSQSIREQITKELGVEPILINSALLSAQNRQRLYWTNIPGVKQPNDRNILLRDILESGLPIREKGYTLRANYGKGVTAEQYVGDGHFPVNGAAIPVNTTVEGKAQCLRATYYKDGIRNMVGNNVDRKTCVAIPIQHIAAGRMVGRRINDQGHRDDYNEAIPRYQRFEVNENPQKTNCITTVEKDNMVAIQVGTPMQPLEYEPLHSCNVAVTDQNIHCSYKDGSGTAQGYTVYFTDVKAPAVIAGHAHKIKIIEQAAGKEHPVYEVTSGTITIKGKQYPIKLPDGLYIIRKLSITECKRLQTVPDSYAFPVSNCQAYKMLGNGWTVDVIAHILSYTPGITTEPLKVLSMYDGMSCGHIALDKLGGQITRYYATEIDKYAIATTQHNYPETIQLGDAFQVREAGWALPI